MDEPLSEGLVLLVSEPLNPGGIAVYTGSLMNGLSAASVRHLLITSAAPSHGVFPDAQAGSMQVFRGLFWSFWRPFIFRKLVAWAREQEPVLIHGLSAQTAPVCAKLAQALGVPFIITVHHFQKRGALHKEKHCAGYIAVSDSLRENVVNDAGIPNEFVHLIPAGMQIPPQKPDREVSKDSVPLITSIGKLIERKDYEVYVKAARIIIDKLGTECSFVLSGEGPEEGNLRRLVKSLKIEKQFTFCHGGTAHDRLLRDTDVYVQCSRVEGFGTMVLQSMAHGVPVVATSTGGIISLVKDGETGYLIPVGDSEVLAARIMALLTDAGLRHRMGTAAHQLAMENFNLDRMMSQTLELYREALGATVRA